jgi:mannose-1-phosphate guanylyltransferase
MRPSVSAAILCGGRGERLRPLTDFFQKAMVPIGPKKRPLLEYLIRLFVYNGIDDIVLLTGYRAREIEEFFGEGEQLGARLSYSEDPKGYSGSANAVANAVRRGLVKGREGLLVYYGDVFSDLNLGQLMAVHRSHDADATLVLAHEYRLPVGVAEVGPDQIVTRFREKPNMELSVTTGCVELGKRAVELIVKNPAGRKSDLMGDFVPEMLSRDMRVAAYYTQEMWHDVGTLANYMKLDDQLRHMELSFMHGGAAAGARAARKGGRQK